MFKNRGILLEVYRSKLNNDYSFNGYQRRKKSDVKTRHFLNALNNF